MDCSENISNDTEVLLKKSRIDKHDENGADGSNETDSDSGASCYEDAIEPLDVNTELEDGEVDNSEEPHLQERIDECDKNSNNDTITGERREEPAAVAVVSASASSLSTKAIGNDSNGDGDMSHSAQSRTPKSNDHSAISTPPPPTPLRYVTMDPPKHPESLRHINIHSSHSSFQSRPQRLTDMRPRPPPFLRYTTMRPPLSGNQHYLDGYYRHQTHQRRNHHYQHGAPSPYQQDYHQWIISRTQQPYRRPQPINSALATTLSHHPPQQNNKTRRRN